MVDTRYFTKSQWFQLKYTEGHIKESGQPLAHYHDGYEIALFIEADLDVFIRNRRFHIKDNDLLLIDAYELHRIFYRPDTPYKRYVLNFQQPYLQPLLDALGWTSFWSDMQALMNRKLTLSMQNRQHLESGLLKLLDRSKAASDVPDSPAGYLLKTGLFEWLWELHKLQDKRWNQHENALSKPVRQAIAYIEQRLEQPIHLDALASHLSLSKYYISRLFKQETTFTIVEYIQRTRIIRAQKMLVHDQASVIEVSLHCGFASLQHFYRIFKRFTHTSPSEFRRRHQR